MATTRLEAYSDAVIAIVLTIMVLELRPPEEAGFAALGAVVPTFLAYVLSFVFLSIYWNNHHHLLFVTEQVDSAVMWANIHLLFWLSLVPFTTAWMSEHSGEAAPTALYGINLLLAAIAYTILSYAIIRFQGPDSPLKTAIGRDTKGKLSLLLYVIAIAAAFYQPGIAYTLYAAVALMWLIPDRRLEPFFPSQ